MKQWYRVADEPPPEGMVCDTISPGGMQQTLHFVSGLWFYPDNTGYVYYTPELWSVAS